MKKIALLFPGQGTQYVGMGKSLYEKYPVVRQTYEEACDILGFNIKGLCFDGDMEELTLTQNAQPALLTAGVAAFRVYMQEIGISPHCSAGHSLGEFTALTCAGAVRFADTLKLVRCRGVFMQEAAASGMGAMAAIGGIDVSFIEKVCFEMSVENQIAVISNYNSADQTVISGHKTAIHNVCNKLLQNGAVITPLKVSAPFHSQIMKPAADKLSVELQKYEYKALLWPVIANINAMPYESHLMLAETLVMQMTRPVQWVDSILYMENQGIEIAIDMGPKSVLGNMIVKNGCGIKSYSFDKEDDRQSLGKELGSTEIEVKNSVDFKHTIVTKCIQIAVCTPNRNWNGDEYQKGVVEPYRRIQKLQEEIKKEGREPTMDEIRQAMDMLHSVFAAKQVPEQEQNERFCEIYDGLYNNQESEI